ncbi:MAG: hypothetical protein LBI28_13865 [Treponema sp.]|jgi:hypothetical protein|nr:hypothetical protein [Treponema sp.]
METIYNGNRLLTIVSIDEINYETFISKDKEYIVMINVANDFEMNLIEKNIPDILNKNCKEIFCINKFCEQMHDKFDDYIFDYEYKNIMTTWEKSDSFDEQCFYFFNAVGAYNDVNFYIILCDNKIKKYTRKFKRYFIKHFEIAKKGIL